MRFQNYFVVDGIKYYTGTVFVIKDYHKNLEATFVCYDTECQKYIYKLKHVEYHAHLDYFRDVFVCVTDKVDNSIHFPEEKVLPDSMISGLTLGWAWYIFLMLIATIFKGNVILWILISYVFFDWRKRKIEKEGHYVEW